MMYGINMPGNYTDVGFLFFYPIYGSTVVQSLFTTGSWQTIYALVWILEKEANKPYNKEVFNFYAGGSLFIYLCHDLWITVIASYAIFPYLAKNTEDGEGISFATSLTLMIVGTELLANLNYYLVVKLASLCAGKKKPRKPEGIE